MKTTLLIIQRIAVFPGFLFIAVLSVIFLLIKYCYNFISFGGEAIAYTHKNERKTIRDVYNLLTEKKSNIEQAREAFRNMGV